jgi:hypothetical protein
VGFFILEGYLSLMGNYKKLLLEEIFTESQGCDVFSDKVNAPYFDNVIKEDLYHFVVKQIKGKIEYMSPEEYLSRVTEMQGSTEAAQRAIISSSRVSELLEKMESGVKLDMPYLLYGVKYNEQEGRHRAQAAQEYGCDQIPVAVFTQVHDKEVLRLALELEHLNDDEAKDRLLKKGFKGVDYYPTVKFTLEKILDAHDAPTEGSLGDKVGEWSDTFDGRGVSTLIKYQFNDYKDEMKFVEIYDDDSYEEYYLDKALDYVMGRTYDMLQFDEYGVNSKKMDLGYYNWGDKLPKRLRDYILSLIKQFQEQIEDLERYNLEDNDELISIISDMQHESPEFNAVAKYLQKLVYGTLRFDVIETNAHKLYFHTRKIRVAIDSRGATVAISNDIIIDSINEYSSGHEMLVKSGLISDLSLGFVTLEKMEQLNPTTVMKWFNKFGLDRIN